MRWWPQLSKMPANSEDEHFSNKLLSANIENELRQNHDPFAGWLLLGSQRIVGQFSLLAGYTNDYTAEQLLAKSNWSSIL